MQIGNGVFFIGNAVRDIEVQTTSGGTKVAHFTLARTRFKGNGNDNATDFVDFTAFGNNAEFAAKYVKKGTKIGVAGSLSTSTYEKDGRRIKTTTVIAESFEFVSGGTTSTKNDSKKEMDVDTSSQPESTFVPIKDPLESDDLPF